MNIIKGKQTGAKEETVKKKNTLLHSCNYGGDRLLPSLFNSRKFYYDLSGSDKIKN